jgi:hypothetical protein
VAVRVSKDVRVRAASRGIAGDGLVYDGECRGDWIARRKGQLNMNAVGGKGRYLIRCSSRCRCRATGDGVVLLVQIESARRERNPQGVWALQMGEVCIVRAVATTRTGPLLIVWYGSRLSVQNTVD